MRRIFGDEALTDLLDISLSSLKRYAGEERATPQVIAERLHWVAMVVADLAGSYNEFGIRRWFERQRRQLDGRSPRKTLGPQWSPRCPGGPARAQPGRKPRWSGRDMKSCRLSALRFTVPFCLERRCSAGSSLARGGRGSSQLFLGHAHWRMGRISSPRRNSRPRGSCRDCSLTLGGRHSRNGICSPGHYQ